MDVDEDDDFYATEDNAPAETATPKAAEAVKPETEQADEDLEEGEEEDEADDGSDDSDIDIITERKDGVKPAPPAQPARYNEIRNIPQRKGSSDLTFKPTAIKKETSKATAAPQASGKDLPGVSFSKIDVNGKPIYEPAGKLITQVNIDEDLSENDKPWRRPGTDVSDYFNYGFDEFTWALYASKQDSIRSEFSADKIALNNKKMFEDMNMMMAMGAMPGMGGAGAGMPGMEGGMPPEMQAMMQQMMAQGGDPSQMDPSAMFGGAAGAGAAQGGQGFGGQGFGGQGQNQFYEGNNRGGGNFRGGRGNRRGQW